MKEFLITLAVVAAFCLAFIVLVDVANSKETTTLDDALERPVVVERSYDDVTGVVCYWTTRYPKYLSCVQIHTPHNRRQLK